VITRHGDGYFGWQEAAPFDAIMITAAVNHIPPPLLKQLKDGGKLILPLGNPFSYQNLTLVTKRENDYTARQITGVLFVPMTGVALDR
jgi:protein-L-isoaspartate(D-aspartate) O-methyltransferase